MNGPGHFSPVDGRWVSHATRVPSGRISRTGRQIHVIPPDVKLMTRVVVRDSGCWEWTGPTNNKGYATCRILGERYAHRASWVLHNGPIPDGLFVCHRCDNPVCVNPDHFFLGTDADNVHDMHAKGRGTPRKTHCDYGHDWRVTPPYEYRTKHGWMQRQCRVCMSERSRRKREAS